MLRSAAQGATGESVFLKHRHYRCRHAGSGCCVKAWHEHTFELQVRVAVGMLSCKSAYPSRRPAGMT